MKYKGFVKESSNINYLFISSHESIVVIEVYLL